MAWPKDKTKPYDPYAPGAPTVKAQDRMNRAAAGAINQVITPARNLSGALGGNVLKGFGDRLSADASARTASANTVANTQANRAARADLGKRFPNGRMVIDQRPAPKPLRPDRAIPGMGPLTANPGTATVAKSAPQINANIPEARKALIDKYSQAGSAQRPIRQNGFSGTQQVGNMDVTFDKSTPLAAREAFMQQPVAPTGQMAQYEKYMNTPRGQNFGVQKIDNTPPPPMGWKSRLAMNKDNTDLEIARMNNRTSSEGNQVQYALGADQNNIAVRGQDLTAQSAAERNRIDAMTAESNSQTSQLDAEGKNLDIREKLAKERDFARYSDPKTTEAERQAIARKWGIKTENSEFDTLDQFDLEGNRTGQTLYNKATGEIIQGSQPQQAPAAAIEFLRKNPDQAENFKRKYGYLPS